MTEGLNTPESVPLKVVHLDDGREWRGGQQQVLLLMTGLHARGVRQWLLTPRSSPLAERLRAAPPGEIVEYDGSLRRPLKELILRERIDIVHAHRGSAHRKAVGLHRRLSRLRPDSAPPRVVSTRRVDFAVKRNFLSRRTYRYPCQHYIAISTGVRDVLVRGGVDSSRIDVVHSGVAPLVARAAANRDALRDELGLQPGEIAVGNVGALTDHKGQRYLIEAAPAVLRAFPQSRFFILGEGELRGDLERRIERLGLGGRVVLVGYVPQARERLGAFDVYVHPSHLEGLGTAILDAMLAGLPVVATGTGGIPDVVVEGETGLLVPPRDADALARRLIELLGMKEEERRAMADRGRLCAETRFSADAMVEGTLAVYRKLMGEGS